MSVRIEAFQVENLRGFRSARIDLRRQVTLLVGSNNSGKTSLLRLLDWTLGADAELVSGHRKMNAQERALLVPARDTRGAARRLTVWVRVVDGRRHRKFSTDKAGLACLRFRVVGNHVFLRLGPPSRSEAHETDAMALDLWNELRQLVSVVLIPASRDASSERFRRTVVRAVRERLRERAIPVAPGGVPREARRVGDAVKSLGKLTEKLTGPLWKEIAAGLPSGMATSGSFTLSATTTDLIDWLADHTRFRLTTGDHDTHGVDPLELGAGLQSLLDLAILMPGSGSDQMILAVEEPEAFLHPSAQRTLARKLLEETPGVQKLVSTHSPVIVDEARYGAIVLVQDHEVFGPSGHAKAEVDEINTALLTGQGSEAVFSRSVLLVEGESDRLFFEALRRRLAWVDSSGYLDRMSVVSAGSSAAFAPWIRLFESYRLGERRPIEWLVTADGVDACERVSDGFRLAGAPLPRDVAEALRAADSAQAGSNWKERVSAVRDVNAIAFARGIRFHLLPVDLEWSALREAGPSLLDALAKVSRCESASLEAVLRRLGSKYGSGPVNEPLKAPWVRGKIAAEMEWGEVSADVRDVLRRWIAGASSIEHADAIIARGAEWGSL